MIEFKHEGSFKNTERFLSTLSKSDIYSSLHAAGAAGVAALARATPKVTSLAAESWRYEVRITKTSATITWLNSDVENGFPVAIMLQYGYATGTGGYVAGRDYINPALQPIFDSIADDVWKAVTSA